MDLITLIVPIYNVEKYLNRCINSIINQSYTYLEIILIDDGSTDNCPEICEEWKKKDNRIKVIHKTNGGLSDARNAGLAISSGKYIAFIDSDDWVHKDYVWNLYSAIKKNNADISACDIQIVYDSSNPDIDNSMPNISSYTPEEALETLISGCKFRAVAWNKLFHKNILRGEWFKEGRYHEDEFFTYKILSKAKILSYVDSKLYYYYQRSGSIMNSISIKHFDALEAYNERLFSSKKIFQPYIKKIK